MRTVGFARSSMQHRAKRHTWLLRGPQWPSLFLRVEKLACLWDRHPGPVSDVPRPADASSYASREAPALGTVLGEAPPTQCVIGISAEVDRRPRRFGRLAV